MSVLVEAISVVVPNAVIAGRYPRGLDGFIGDCPNRTFCTDGTLVRVGFLARRHADFFVGLLETAGLRAIERGVVRDVALIDQNLGPTAPCLWLDFGREADGVPCCWHAAHGRGALNVPAGWERADLFRAPAFADHPFEWQLRLVSSESAQDWYHDRATGQLLVAARPFVVH